MRETWVWKLYLLYHKKSLRIYTEDLLKRQLNGGRTQDESGDSFSLRTWQYFNDVNDIVYSLSRFPPISLLWPSRFF